jgi:hypothetical protein
MKNFVVCLKWGDKYNSNYVNTLKNMVDRNTTVDYEFVCFTDNGNGIDPGIRVLPLPKLPIQGWWYKPWFFSPDLPINGNILYFDLDVIIFKNIDHLWTYEPDRFVICRDFNRHLRPDWKKMNSSVWRLKSGTNHHVWEDFKDQNFMAKNRMHGDQDWIYSKITKDFCFWPDEWIQSYKWEMRGKPEMTRINGVRNFAIPGEPKIKDQTSVAVFHGEPHPHNCVDPWCKENWY